MVTAMIIASKNPIRLIGSEKSWINIGDDYEQMTEYNFCAIIVQYCYGYIKVINTSCQKFAKYVARKKHPAIRLATLTEKPEEHLAQIFRLLILVVKRLKFVENV